MAKRTVQSVFDLNGNLFARIVRDSEWNEYVVCFANQPASADSYCDTKQDALDTANWELQKHNERLTAELEAAKDAQQRAEESAEEAIAQFAGFTIRLEEMLKDKMSGRPTRADIDIQIERLRDAQQLWANILRIKMGVKA